MIFKAIFWILVAWWLLVAVFSLARPLPTGVNLAPTPQPVPETSVSFLADYTYVDNAGQRHSDQRIFNEILAMIDRAQQIVLVDMFLWNDFEGRATVAGRPLAGELTDRLIAKKRQRPEIEMVVISDPVNTVYGGVNSPYFDKLVAAGIPVVLTDLKQLRDSNPLYSSLWRTYVQWFGNSVKIGRVTHPFSANAPKVTARSYLALLNFKANHRKVIVADETTADGVHLAALVTSANPHNGSSAHGNVAIKSLDGIGFDLLNSEQAVLNFSAGPKLRLPTITRDPRGAVQIQILTETKIKDSLIRQLKKTQTGDRVDIVMFYLSDRRIIKTLLDASERGVNIRLILDPNKDAFGRTKNGVPNRPVAHELVEKSGNKIAIRWCDTHGEQCHSKMILVYRKDENSLMLGSANLTRRNINNFNLETNILAQSKAITRPIAEAGQYMETLWNNQNGRIFTAPYEKYADDSLKSKLLYRAQEFTGLSSF